MHTIHFINNYTSIKSFEYVNMQQNKIHSGKFANNGTNGPVDIGHQSKQDIFTHFQQNTEFDAFKKPNHLSIKYFDRFDQK